MKAIVFIVIAILLVSASMAITHFYTMHTPSVIAGVLAGVGFAFQWGALSVIYKPERDQP